MKKFINQNYTYILKKKGPLNEIVCAETNAGRYFKMLEGKSLKYEPYWDLIALNHSFKSNERLKCISSKQNQQLAYSSPLMIASFNEKTKLCKRYLNFGYFNNHFSNQPVINENNSLFISKDL